MRQLVIGLLKTLLAVAAVFAAPVAAQTKTNHSDWVEMVRACETVIWDQDFAPLRGYEPAPFSSGLPGVRQYAVYNAPKSLIAIATLSGDIWGRCLVRETEESHTRWRDLGKQWTEGFGAAYPGPKYQHVSSRFDPNRPFPGAARCREKHLEVLIIPSLAASFAFRVEITNFLYTLRNDSPTTREESLQTGNALCTQSEP